MGAILGGCKFFFGVKGLSTTLTLFVAVGMIMGFIFGMIVDSTSTFALQMLNQAAKGGFNIMRYGAGPNGPMRTLAQYMLGSGATFGYTSFVLPALQEDLSQTD